MVGGMCGRGAMHGGGVHDGGPCMVGGMCGWGVRGRYYKIRSMSGQYTSYWNAFLLLLSLARYLLPVTTPNRYQSTGSSGTFYFTTTSRNVTIVRCRMSLVTIPVLDFVIIH